MFTCLCSVVLHRFAIPSNLIGVRRQGWTLAAGGKSF